jgi:hypothetical protein
MSGKSNPMRCIQRVDKGHHAWRVVMRRMDQHLRQFFADSAYGGKDQALAAAVAWRDQNEAAVSVVDLEVWNRDRTRASNKSGVVGVYRHINVKKRKDGPVMFPQWIGYWQNADGKRSLRSFNVAKYGEETAKQLAIRARQDGMADVARQFQIKLTTQTANK